MKRTEKQYPSNFTISLYLAVVVVMFISMIGQFCTMVNTPKIPAIDTKHVNIKNNLKTYYYVGDVEQERMLTGWISIDDQWHFFDHNTGEMVVNSWMHDESRGGECFFDENGVMQLGWVIIDGNQYYFSLEEEDYGNAVTGTRTIDGKEYCFDSDGVLM